MLTLLRLLAQINTLLLRASRQIAWMALGLMVLVILAQVVLAQGDNHLGKGARMFLVILIQIYSRLVVARLRIGKVRRRLRMLDPSLAKATPMSPAWAVQT